jgi:hypothetical protein
MAFVRTGLVIMTLMMGWAAVRVGASASQPHQPTSTTEIR